MTARPRASANGHRAEPPHRPADWSAASYRPAEGTPLLRCTRCGAAYLNDDPGRQAHITVFSHSPKPEPATPPKETTP